MRRRVSSARILWTSIDESLSRHDDLNNVPAGSYEMYALESSMVKSQPPAIERIETTGLQDAR